MTAFAAQSADLARLAAAGRLRSLAARAGRDFASNDYLALAGSDALRNAAADALARGVPVGAGGSRLLRGNHPEHEALEADAARVFGSESALFFATGYAANVALFATLPQRGDRVFHDALIHASTHDGLRLSRADAEPFRHNDAAACDAAIRRWRGSGATGRPWIACESLYSMDGDLAPLADLAALAERHDGVMLVDEAHATGVLGQGGRGLAAALADHGRLVTLHTCGKALGCEGALVCSPAIVRDALANRARPFIFSTAPSPLMAAVARTALALLDDAPQLRMTLADRAAKANAALRDLGLPVSGTHILPVILGDDARAMAVAAQLQAKGFDVRGIRPPTVAPGTARLRISVTLHASPADIAALAEALKEALA